MLKLPFALLLAHFLCIKSYSASPTDPVERWDQFELSLKGPQKGNPFADVWLTAEFSKGSSIQTVQGFYDGDGIFIIRFMPSETGSWKYVTKSNTRELHNKTGTFTCIPPSSKNHGPVQVYNTYNFRYSDGKTYYPFGTTIYAWTHQNEPLEELTLQTLQNSCFNKVRMCVFPKYYTYVEDEPLYYPYVQTGSADTAGHAKKTWDFSRFNPQFFRHLEKRIKDLNERGIEADLILFHPYDKGHWGFDSMGKEADIRYLKYLVARLASFRNVWWSMANEFDFIKSKPREVWDEYTKTVVQADPYRHLCSIHNGSVYYDNWKPEFTHVSIQNGSAVEDFGRATLLRDAYFKPVIYDEVCYEGDLPQRWGRLSGEEMVHAFWQGIIAGTYVTHGETYLNKGDTVFWAKGGRLVGSSPARIAFLKKIMEDGPGPLQLADVWKDNHTAMSGTGYYLIYFGKEMQASWQFNLPKKNSPAPGTKFRVDIIDTWDMTIKPLKDTFEIDTAEGYKVFDKHLKSIQLPMKPYLALRLVKIPD